MNVYNRILGCLWGAFFALTTVATPAFAARKPAHKKIGERKHKSRSSCSSSSSSSSSSCSSSSSTSHGKKVYDYVIVGAGSAGCILARKLSDSKKKSVFVITDGINRNDNPLILATPSSPDYANALWSITNDPQYAETYDCKVFNPLQTTTYTEGTSWGGSYVDVRGDAIDHATRREVPGPTDVARHPDAALVDRPLVTPQARVEPRLGRAVIREEADDRVVRQPLRRERLEDPADVGIDVGDHRVDLRDIFRGLTRLGRDRAAHPGEGRVGEVHLLVNGEFGLGGLERLVGAVEREVGEERPIVGRADEVDGGVGIDVAAITLHRPEPAVLHEDGVEVVAPARRVGVLTDAPASKYESFLKPLIDRPHRGVVAEVPLAEDRRPIPGRGEYLGNRGLIGVHQRPPEIGIDDPGPVVVPAGHQAGPRRRADGRDAEVLEPDALPREPVKMGRLDHGIAVIAEVAEAHVVGDDHEDVGPPGRPGLPLRRPRGHRHRRRDGRRDEPDPSESPREHAPTSVVSPSVARRGSPHYGGCDGGWPSPSRADSMAVGRSAGPDRSPGAGGEDRGVADMVPGADRRRPRRDRGDPRPGSRRLDVIDRVFRPDRGRSMAATPPGRLRLGRAGTGAGDEVVAVRLESAVPTFEIQCHGGPAAVAAVVEALRRAGANPADRDHRDPDPGDDAIRAAAREDLASAPTLRVAEILLDQVHGASSRSIERLINQARSGATLGPTSPLLADVDGLLRTAGVGTRLLSGWKVVIAGRPNVGKSRLFNAMAGFTRSIVHRDAGVTRDVVTVRTAFGGWPVELADTAGERDSGDAIENLGVIRARQERGEADLVLLVLDRSEPLHPVNLDLMASVVSPLVAANKSDLPPTWPAGQIEHAGCAVYPVSAATRDGLDELVGAMVSRIVPEPPTAGGPVLFRPVIMHPMEQARIALTAGDRDGFVRRLSSRPELLSTFWAELPAVRLESALDRGS